jgi:hypothetical protein
MVVPAGQLPCINHAQGTRHAQVYQQRSRRCPEQQVFSPPIDGLNALADKLLPQPLRHGPAQPRLPHNQRLYHLAPTPGGKPPAGGLDLG